MKGDFSRDSFDLRKRYTRVLMQQGRVQLDADWNEQADILLHQLRVLAADIFGQHGGPRGSMGFEVFLRVNSSGDVTDLMIAPGHYYVNGILCENDQRIDMENNTGVRYFDQPYFPLTTQLLRDKYKLPDPITNPFIVYLDVWERHVTSIEDPSMREMALGGTDTTTRTQVIWQVRVLPLGDTELAEVTCQNVQNTRAWRDNLVIPMQRRGMLRAKAQEVRPADIGDPCAISPDARYRGTENKLYRVEIHRDGTAATATFKWSGDNGSVVFPIERIGGKTVTLSHLGRDARLSVRANDWVEIVDDEYVLRNEAYPLLEVDSVDPIEMTVTLKTEPNAAVGRNRDTHPLMRRWEQKEGDSRTGGLDLDEGAARIVESSSPLAGWLSLEDGIQIQFQPGATYRTGDYWLIEARTATGDIVWPREDGQPLALPPHGIDHYYAPLANMYGQAAPSKSQMVFDLRHSLVPAGCHDDFTIGGFGCPVVMITGFTNPDKKTLQFNADVSGGNPSLNPSYQWFVQGGTITVGQGTFGITVTPTGPAPVTAKVKITNFPAPCRNMATLTLQLGENI
jgi:hypothetical protein